MGHILGLKFKDYGQVYYFDSGAFVVAEGDHVIVKTDLGMGLGRVVLVRDDLPEDMGEEDIKPIYRLATEEDLERLEENVAMATEAFEFCRKCIFDHKLEMKLVDVDVYFDRSKIVFFFTAPNRIDFRELVKDLVKNYRTRIELRQIGVRHETQMVGAVGNCGQVCCCRRFLRKFAPVTIRMAKEQNLFLNPTKISGICGRLLCCLNYEQKNYESFRKKCPKMGKRYDTAEGPVKVIRANMFRETLSLITMDGEELEVSIDDWREMSPERIDPAQFQQQQQQVERKKSKPLRRKNTARPSLRDDEPQEQDLDPQLQSDSRPTSGQNGSEAVSGERSSADSSNAAGSMDSGPTTYDLTHALGGDPSDDAGTDAQGDAPSEGQPQDKPRPKRTRRSRRPNRKGRDNRGKSSPRKDGSHEGKQAKAQKSDNRADSGDKDSRGPSPARQAKDGQNKDKPRRKRRRRPRRRPNSSNASGAQNKGPSGGQDSNN